MDASALSMSMPMCSATLRTSGFFRASRMVSRSASRLAAWSTTAAASADGKLLALRGHFRHDHGAFTPSGLSLPQNATTNLLGPYVLPALALEVSACLTNMVAATSTRG